MKKKLIVLTLSVLTLAAFTSCHRKKPTALCNDGTYSYSKHRSGTCSSHGGVDKWYYTEES
ncbi:MAG: DUF3761 domain-containing protein [Bacteroidales bacterium]|nr:DUF3761 domain-containing protein [Bacteroidales bacterium]